MGREHREVVPRDRGENLHLGGCQPGSSCLRPGVGAIGPRGADARIEQRVVDNDLALDEGIVEARRMPRVEAVEWSDDHRFLETRHRCPEGRTGKPCGASDVARMQGGLVAGLRTTERGVRSERGIGGRRQREGLGRGGAGEGCQQERARGGETECPFHGAS